MGDDRFTCDQAYLRTEQYGTTDKLAARQRLHTRYTTAAVRWFPWLVDQVAWRSGPVVEVGCGAGHLWEEGRPPVDGPVTLIDLSAGMVDAAVARTTAAGYAVEGRVAAAERLPIADGAAVHVIANHMLYHVPHPPDAVAELARIASDDAIAVVATNGAGHFRETKEIEHAVFGSRIVDRTVEAFGLENGGAMLAERFGSVDLVRYPDTLRVTDPDDVMSYMASYPPVEDGSVEQLADLRRRVEEVFAAGGGEMTITKDVGLFLCHDPRRA